MRSVKHLCLILVFLCALPIAALAQLGGSIAGTITDPNGAVVPGAKVTATQVTTGLATTVVSTPAGLYSFPLLKTGPYSITVTQAGFKTLVRAGIEVRVGLAENIDIKLELGTVQQTVEVKASAPVLDTINATVGINMSPQTLDQLPLFNGSLRLANGFVGYMPGVNGNGETSINGSTGRGSEVMVDGGSMVNPESGGVVFYFPGMEAYSEFKLVTSGFTAENGRTGGGIQEFVTKSGTNQFHGSAFFNFKRQFFDAVSWANNQNPAQRGNPLTGAVPTLTECKVPQATACRPMERYNEEGGSAGGPVYIPHVYDGRNKTFWFFTYAGFWQPAAVTVNSGESTPTAAMVQGNFAGLKTIYDPANIVAGARQPFPGNAIPAARFSAISKNYLPFIQAPNVGTSVNPAGNYTYNSTNLITDMDWSIKVDHQIRNNHRIAFFYTRRNNQSLTDQYYPGPLTNGLKSVNAPKQLRIGHTWTVNPHTVLSSFFSMSTDNQTWFNPSQNGYGCKLGFTNLLCGTNQDATPVTTFETDLITPNGTGISTGSFPCATCMTWGMDQGKVNNGGQLNWTLMGASTLSWIRGKHEFKLGGDVRRPRTFGHDWASTNGAYLFSNVQTAAVSNDTATGNSFASFLLGNVDKASQGWAPPFYGSIRYGYQAGFFQDTWRIKPRITLDLGIRYEVPVGWHFPTGNYSAFNPTLPDPTAGNLPGGMIYMGSGPGRTGANRPYPTDFSDVGPRLGIAWRMTDTIVVRSAFGIFYEGLGNGGCGCTDGFNGSFLQQSDGFNPAFNWDPSASKPAGVQPPLGYVPPPNLVPGFDNFNGGMYYMGPHMGKAPRVYEYNLTVQKQYKNWLFEGAYIGNRAHGLASTAYMNTVPDAKLYLGSIPVALTAGGITQPVGTNVLGFSFNNPAQATFLNALGYYSPSGVGSLACAVGPCGSVAGWPTTWTTGWAGGATLAQSLRPFPQYGTIYSANSGDGYTWYDSFQGKIEHRFGDLNSEVSYVFSKNLDQMAYRQIFTQCCVEQTQDASNIPDSKTFSFMDLPHVVNFTMSYNLPFGRGKKFAGNSGGVVNKVIGGWTVAGLGQYRSGGLIQLITQGNPLGNELFSPLTKAMQVGTVIKTHVATNTLDPNNPTIRWFTTSTSALAVTSTNPTGATGSAAFAQTPNGAFGNASIMNGQFRQPWYRYDAISINKIIGIYGEGRVYLRYSVNVFNPFNRTSFGGINGAINNINFGRPGGASDNPRNITMGLRLYF